LRFFLLFIFLSVLLNADNYPYFSKKTIKLLEKQYGYIVKNRTQDYQDTIEKIKSYPKEKQLNSINVYLNQLLSQYDSISKKCADYWKSPVEFLIHGNGDCEDYAIIKYFSLIKLGYDKNKLFLTIVKDRYSSTMHMVLSYFDKDNLPPLILDNLSFKILRLDKRIDLVPYKLMNDTGTYKIDKNFKLKKIKYQDFKYINLMKKIKKEKKTV